jgi:hypothetical protein
MAKTKISEFSATPANNTDIDGININEGCAPSGINDAIRELMAQLKDFQTGAVGDSFNGPIGTSTAAAGAFTTLSASGTATLSGLTASTALALDASKNIVSVTNTGTGSNVLATSPTLVTPALGTPSSGVVTNLTGTASININGTVGATTASTGAFTTLAASGATSLTGSATIFNSATNTLSLQKSDGAASILFGSNTAANGRITSIASGGLFFSTGDITQTEKLRITAGGDVGIGTSSPSAKLHVKVGTDQNLHVSTSGSVLGLFSVNDAVSAPSPMQIQGTSLRFNTGTGPAVETMRLDSSGNLGLGVTPSAWAGQSVNYDVLQAGLSSFANIADNAAEVSYNQYIDSGGTRRYIASNTAMRYRMGNTEHQWFTAASGTAGNAITFTQAMTLDASGNLLVGKTSSAATSVGWQGGQLGEFYVTKSTSTNADATYYLYSTGAGAYRFYVGLGGTISATSTTITGISDQRLKENIRDLDDGLDIVMALKPRKFDWKEGKGANIKNARGFIAQEFEQVLPDMIEEWKDPAPEGEEPYKAVNANLIPTLVKAIQEQQAIINSLKARLDAANL